MVFNATFNNISIISCQSVLLVEEIGVPEENHQPVASHWPILEYTSPEQYPRCRSFYEDNNSLKTKLKTLSMDGKQINSNWLVSY
jgi:hypothetical protein